MLGRGKRMTRDGMKSPMSKMEQRKDIGLKRHMRWSLAALDRPLELLLPAVFSCLSLLNMPMFFLRGWAVGPCCGLGGRACCQVHPPIHISDLRPLQKLLLGFINRTRQPAFVLLLLVGAGGAGLPHSFLLELQVSFLYAVSLVKSVGWRLMLLFEVYSF
ncbi:hypothetical protein U1Q18_001584 [Sarracenia purpurea var. burkii]